MSFSDSSDELHDIDWEAPTPFFDYNDPYSLSPQHTAVIQNDVKRLKTLLNSGKSVNVCDNHGNTPLHVAVLKDKKKIFDYLLTVEDLRIDERNHDGLTALVMALMWADDYYALCLIEKGANVNVAKNSGDTPLHYVTGKMEIARKLIEKGGDINQENNLGETPLFVACEKGDCELIYLLLYYGANGTCDGILPFAVSMVHCPFQIQEILFDYTFNGDKIEIWLNSYVYLMVAKSPFFYKMIEHTSRIIYNEDDLFYLHENLGSIKMDFFWTLMDKFGYVAQDFFQVCDSLSDFVTFMTVSHNIESDFMDFFYKLCDSPYIETILEEHNPNNCIIHSIINRKVSEVNVTKLVCCLLSCGMEIIPDDLNMVYKWYGFNELFKILLHTEFSEKNSRFEQLSVSLIPILIYKVDLNFSIFYQIPRETISENCYELLKKFFTISEIGTNLVPSLIELSRNSAREYLIKKFKIKNNVKFFTLLKHLPISQIYKSILCYEKPLYV